MPDNSTITADSTGVFTRDQAEILSARKTEPDWLRAQRLRAQEIFERTPMPDTRPEEWRYTPIADILKLEAVEFADEAKPVSGVGELPAPLQLLMADAGEAAARLVQTDASLVMREVPAALAEQGVVFSSLDAAVRDHSELVERFLGTAAGADIGKFAALDAAFWSGGTFVYVPKGVRLELPLRAFRWLSREGTASATRTLVVAERDAEVTLIDEYASEDFERQTLSLGGTEIFAADGAKVSYFAVQRWGRGVVHLTTERLVSGRDARISSLNVALGSDLTRSDVQCKLDAPGAHADLLGLYIADGAQHFDHETLQDHVAPHASSNLLFKGALFARGRSVFRGLIRVHPGAQRTDAYQTNRNLILSNEARADSLPNLEIGADDVRCSHAATIGQLDTEEIFYLQSRGIQKREAVRLVIFGFFGEVLDQIPHQAVRAELVRAIEKKLHENR